MQKQRLTGKRIAITRAIDQMDTVVNAVEALGGIPIRFPCLAVHCLPDEVRLAATRLAGFDDVLFTSANGVNCVSRILDNLATSLQGKRIAAVGQSTADALKEHGIQTDIVPATASQEGLIEAYRSRGLPKSLLFFRAEEGREILASTLQSMGVRVETIPAYRTVCPDEDASEMLALLQNHAIDAVLLGSSKAARHYLMRIGDPALADRPVIVAISEQVAGAAQDAGLSVQITAETASFDAMLDALADYFATTAKV